MKGARDSTLGTNCDQDAKKLTGHIISNRLTTHADLGRLHAPRDAVAADERAPALDVAREARAVGVHVLEELERRHLSFLFLVVFLRVVLGSASCKKNRRQTNKNNTQAITQNKQRKKTQERERAKPRG